MGPWYQRRLECQTWPVSFSSIIRLINCCSFINTSRPRDPQTGYPYGAWQGLTPMFSYLSKADPKNTIGVQNGTLYDIIDNNNGTGNVYVDATSFDVTCGSVANVTVSVIPSNQTQIGEFSVAYEQSSNNISIPIGNANIQYTIFTWLTSHFFLIAPYLVGNLGFAAFSMSSPVSASSFMRIWSAA